MKTYACTQASVVRYVYTHLTLPGQHLLLPPDSHGSDLWKILCSDHSLSCAYVQVRSYFLSFRCLIYCYFKGRGPGTSFTPVCFSTYTGLKTNLLFANRLAPACPYDMGKSLIYKKFFKSIFLGAKEIHFEFEIYRYTYICI